MNRFLPVVNPAAGSGYDPQAIAALRELFQSRGLAVHFLPARYAEELRSIATSALRQKPQMIVAGGGDAP